MKDKNKFIYKYEDNEKRILKEGVYKEYLGVYHYNDGICYKITFNNGDSFYYNTEGLYHREDGPAKEYQNGIGEWFLNNYLVYSNEMNNIHKFENLSESFKQSIIKNELNK
jgi:hypothetical protein